MSNPASEKPRPLESNGAQQNRRNAIGERVVTHIMRDGRDCDLRLGGAHYAAHTKDRYIPICFNGGKAISGKNTTPRV
jgi:hypothetical protein